MSLSAYERERQRDLAGMARARLEIRRAGRINAVVRRLQPFVDRIEDRLREERRDAMRSGENHRRILVEAEIDELHRELNGIVQGLVKDLT